MARLVIDISRWDEGIDLVSWKSHRGCWGVIIKAGGNEGGRYRDSQFESHYAKAKALGLKVGVYFYSTVTSASEARADAEHLLSLVSGKSLDLPAYIDVEDPAQPLIGARALTDVCLAFCRRIEAAGLRAGVYTSGSWWKSNLIAYELKPYSRWVAYWTGSKPSGFADYELWQQGGMRLGDGNVVFDDVSGYVDCNWWYGEEGASVVPSNRLSYADMAAEVMDHVIDHDAHGYSQPNRAGDGTVESITLSDGTVVKVHGGDYDCSELVRMCYAAAGVLPWGYYDSYMWTGNEDEMLTSHGFVTVPLDEARRGDVLWRKGHTELHLGNGMCGGARGGDAPGGLTGVQGDQSGNEITRGRYYPSSWSVCYRCTLVREGSDIAPVKKCEEDEMVCILQAGENGQHLYYFDGTRARHISPVALSGIQKAWQGTHDGGLITVKTLTQDEIDAMCAL